MKPSQLLEKKKSDIKLPLKPKNFLYPYFLKI